MSWTAPSDNGSALTGYHICVDGCENAVGTPDSNDALVAGDATTAKFSHPTDGTNHTYRIYAANAVGYALNAPVVTVDVPAKAIITFDLGLYLQNGDSNPDNQYAPVGSTLALPTPTYGDLTFLGWSNGGSDPVTTLNVSGDTDLVAVFSPNSDATMLSLSQDGTEITLKDGNTYYANWDRFNTSTDFTLVLPPGAYVSGRVDIQTGPIFTSLTLTNKTFTLNTSNFCNTYPCSGSYSDHTEITFTVTSEDGQNSTDYTLRVARPIDWNNYWIWYQDPIGGNSAITTDVYGSQYEAIVCPQQFSRDGYELAGFVDANNSSTTYACDQILLINFNLSLYATWNELPPVLPPDPTPTSINIYGVSYSVADCSNLPGELCLTSAGVEYEPDNSGNFYISQFQSSVASWSVSSAVTDGVTSSVGIELNIQGATDFSYFTGSQTTELENAITQHCTNQALPSGCSIWTGVAVSTENSAQDQVDIYVNMLTFVGITSGATATITFSTDESSLTSYMPSTLTTAMGWIDTPDVVDVTDAHFSQSYWDSSYLQWGFEPGEMLPLLQDLTLVAGVQPEIQMNYYVGDELVYTQISYAYYMLDRPGDFPTTENSDLFYWHLAGSDQAVNPWAGNQIDYTESLNWYAVSFVDQMSLTLSEDSNGPLLSLDLTVIQDAHLDFSVSYEGVCEGSDQWVELPQPDFPWAYYLADLGAACSQVRAVVAIYKNDVFLETGNLLANIPISEPDQNQNQDNTNQDNTSQVQSPSSPVEQVSDPTVADVTDAPALAMRQIGNKFRAALFNIVGVGKVQIIQNGREIGWVRAASIDDPKLRTADDGNRYFVRTRPLRAGVNTIKILIEGKVFSSTKFTLAG